MFAGGFVDVILVVGVPSWLVAGEATLVVMITFMGA